MKLNKWDGWAISHWFMPSSNMFLSILSKWQPKMRFKSIKFFWDTLYMLRSTWNSTSETVWPFHFDLCPVVTWICQFYQNGNQKWGLKVKKLFWDTLYMLRSTWNSMSETVGQFCFDLRPVVTWFCQFYQNGNQNWGLKVTNCSGTPCMYLDQLDTWRVRRLGNFLLIYAVW